MSKSQSGTKSSTTGYAPTKTWEYVVDRGTEWSATAGFILPSVVLTARPLGTGSRAESPNLPPGPPTCIHWKAGRAYSGEPDAGICHKPGFTLGYVCDRRMHALEIDDLPILLCCTFPGDEDDDKEPYFNPV